MKKLYVISSLLALILFSIIYWNSCNALTRSPIAHLDVIYSSELSTVLYSIEQFNDITIGESTYDDVNQIAPVSILYCTSYGGYTEYTCEDGKRIHIKFYGPDMIVYSIEVIGQTDRS